MELLTAILLILALCTIIFFMSKKMKKANKKIKRLQQHLDVYYPITNISEAAQAKKQELAKLQKEAEELNQKFQIGKETLARLESEISIYEEGLELMDFGVYNPIFDLETSEEYKDKIKKVVERQKDLIKRERAAVCNTNWSVGGSAKQGEVMTRRYLKLILRAFNGEADALIAKVKWNNVYQFKERLNKAFEALNKLGKSNDVYITEKYLQLKIDELYLVYELERKKYEEKEEQRLIREQMREEEKVQRELERVQREAEEEEKRYEKALQQAQKQLEKAQGDELEKLNDQIFTLKLQLEQAHSARERAMSRAQMTKSGHVYIISNIGSFGENRYKIGMTRRLEPMDRIKELGDASVPFGFDVHAIIYSDNAPELENIFHKAFHHKRLNMVNTRKEFFDVSLDEIEKVIIENTNAEIQFTKMTEAREYRETLAMLERLTQEMHEKGKKKSSSYPDALF